MKNVSDLLGFGCASLSSMRTSYEVQILLNCAYNLGIRHFDTAPLYGNGYSELLLGSFIKNKRSQITVTTKFGLGGQGYTPIPPSAALPLNYFKKKFSSKQTGKIVTPDLKETNPVIPHRSITHTQIEEGLNASLRRLKSGYIDYYLLHEGIPSFLTDEALKYLEQKIKDGVIHKVGIASNYSSVLPLASQLADFWEVVQYEYDTDDPSEMLRLFPDRIHIQHSCLKHVNSDELNNDPEFAGTMLAQSARTNPNGITLFSTRRKNVLETNIKSFLKHFQ
jgi:aryl-alcohol dehydrogenase-like predicted oxidoreductase